jgi:hypothetical protein
MVLGIALVIEHLPSKNEDLNSEPQYCQKKKERKKEKHTGKTNGLN